MKNNLYGDSSKEGWFRVDAGILGPSGANASEFIALVTSILKNYETQTHGSSGFISGERLVTGSGDDLRIQKTLAVKIKKSLEHKILTELQEAIEAHPIFGDAPDNFKLFDAGMSRTRRYKETFVTSPSLLKGMQSSLNQRNATVFQENGVTYIEALGSSTTRAPSVDVSDIRLPYVQAQRVLNKQAKVQAHQEELDVLNSTIQEIQERNNAQARAEEENIHKAFLGRRAYGKILDRFQTSERKRREAETNDIIGFDNAMINEAHRKDELRIKEEEEERHNAYMGRRAYGRILDKFQVSERKRREAETNDLIGFDNAMIEEAHRKDEQRQKEEAKRAAERDKELKKGNSFILRSFSVLVATTLSILHAVNKIVTSTTERAKEALVDARTARNMGMSPKALNDFRYLAISKGLDENIFTDVFADMQSRFGDIMSLQANKLPASFDVVVGNKLAKLFSGGITGENSEEFVRTILDAYLARFRSGIGTTGQAMSEDKLRVNLYNSLKQFSPDLANILASILDYDPTGATNFEGFKKTVTPGLGLQGPDLEAFTKLGKATNELSATLKAFSEKFSLSFVGAITKIAEHLNSILQWLDKDTDLTSNQAAVDYNRNLISVTAKDAAAFEAVANSYLASGVTFRQGASQKQGPVVHSLQEFYEYYGSGDFLTALGDIRLQGIFNPEFQVALAGYRNAMKANEEASKKYEKGSRFKAQYDDYTTFKMISDASTAMYFRNVLEKAPYGQSYNARTKDLEEYRNSTLVALPTGSLSSRNAALWERVKAAGAESSPSAQLDFARKLRAAAIKGTGDYGDYADFLHFAGLSDAMVVGKTSSATSDEIDYDYQAIKGYDMYRDLENELKTNYSELWQLDKGDVWRRYLKSSPYDAGDRQSLKDLLEGIRNIKEGDANVSMTLNVDGYELAAATASAPFNDKSAVFSFETSMTNNTALTS